MDDVEIEDVDEDYDEMMERAEDADEGQEEHGEEELNSHERSHRNPEFRAQAASLIVATLTRGLANGPLMYGGTDTGGAATTTTFAPKGKNPRKTTARGKNEPADDDAYDKGEDTGEGGEAKTSRALVNLNPMQYEYLEHLDRRTKFYADIMNTKYRADWMMHMMYACTEFRDLVFRYTELDRIYRMIMDADARCSQTGSGFCGGLLAEKERLELYNITKPQGWIKQTQFETWEDFLAEWECTSEPQLLPTPDEGWCLRRPCAWKKMEEDAVVWYACCNIPAVRDWLLSIGKDDSPAKLAPVWLEQFIFRECRGLQGNMFSTIERCMLGQVPEPCFVHIAKYAHTNYLALMHSSGSFDGGMSFTRGHDTFVREMNKVSAQLKSREHPPFPIHIKDTNR